MKELSETITENRHARIQEQNSSQIGVIAEEGFNIRRYWHILLERKWLALAAFLIFFILTIFYVVKAERIYESTFRLQIDPEAPNGVTQQAVSITSSSRDVEYFQTQIKNIVSQPVLESVIHELDLQKDPRYVESLDILDDLKEDITIQPLRLTRLVEVSVQHPNPKRAQQIAQSLSDHFVNYNFNNKIEESKKTFSYYDEEAQTYRQRVEEAERKLQEYRRQHQEVSFQEDMNIVSKALIEARTLLTSYQSEAAAAAGVVENVRKELEAGTPLSSIPQVADHPVIGQYQVELGQLQSALAGLLERYKDQYPDVQKVRAEIAELEIQIEQKSIEIYEKLKQDAEQARIRAVTQQKLVDQAIDKAQELNELSVDYGILKRESEVNKALYEQLLTSMKEAELIQEVDPNNIRQVNKPQIPMKFVKPRIALTLAAGMMGGMIVGFGLAFFVNYLDDSVKSQDDVEHFLRTPFLGYIPTIKATNIYERVLQAHLDPQANASEGFRSVRASLELANRAENLRVIAITSTIPNEGKSLFAANFATVLAQTGARTLLVDADMRKPSVHRAFKLHSPSGLATFLQNETPNPDDFIHKTEVPNLDVVCCGKTPNYPSELASSKRMDDFVDLMRERYDRVILDCPPISAVSDPLVIASRANGVLYVTRFNKIRRDHARKTVQRMHDAGLAIFGTVINDIDLEGREAYYYSYYYYQNSHYKDYYSKDSDDEETDSKSRKS